MHKATLFPVQQTGEFADLVESMTALNQTMGDKGRVAESRSEHRSATFAGDIGDTKTGLVTDSGEFWPHTPLAPTEVCRADYARLKETVEEFLAEVMSRLVMLRVLASMAA